MYIKYTNIYKSVLEIVRIILKKRIKKELIAVAKKANNYLNDKPRLRSAAKKTVRKVESVFRFNIIPNSDTYPKWLKNNTLSVEFLKKQAGEVTKLNKKPLITVITPVYNTDHKALKNCIDSVISQTYTNWELILVDDCSTDHKIKEILNTYIKKDERIKTIYNSNNLHISESTNIGVSKASGDYIALLDHDDIIYPNALYENALAINTSDPEFIYSDEDKVSENGKKRFDPFFKPDWSPDFLRSINYITHFAVIKKSLILKAGGFRKEYDGAQDWDLFLRTTRMTAKIYHISKVLYGWRVSATSTAKDVNSKPYVINAQKNALIDDAIARGFKDINLAQSKKVKDYWELTHKVAGKPLVSIVIPSKDQYEVAKRCIDSIINKSTYTNYEIIIVDTGSKDSAVLDWYKKLSKNKSIKIIDWPEQPFSYARACNEGAKHAKGDYLIMLNNDTEVITVNWIELMLGDAQRRGIGTVGARLYYPGNIYIQHAGIGLGLGGYAANLLSGINDKKLNSIQSLYANNKRNVACSTAACLMLSRKTYFKVGGFDESFRITYNDVDLGLKILNTGLLNIYNPLVELTHHESISLGRPDDSKRDSKEFIEAKNLLASRWNKYIRKDPYYNDNFLKDSASFLY